MKRTKNAVFVSSGAFRTRVLSEVLARAADWGIAALELSSGVAWSSDNLRLARDAARNGMELLVHNYFPPPETPFVLNLAAADSAVRTRSIDHCRRAMDLTAELGAPFYSVHSGFAVSPKPDQLGHPLAGAPRTRMPDAERWFVESASALCEHAAGHDIVFAVENNVLASFNLIEGRNEMLLCVTPDDIRRFLGAVRSPRLAILLDIAHAFVSSRALGVPVDGYFDGLSDDIAVLHVSENDGNSDQNLPLRPDSWFLPRLAGVGSKRHAPVVLESYGLEREQILAGVAVLNSALQSRASA